MSNQSTSNQKNKNRFDLVMKSNHHKTDVTVTNLNVDVFIKK